MPGNKDAAFLYFRVERQVIATFGQVIDINHLAIYAAMELYGVKDKIDCFEKITEVFSEMRREESLEEESRDKTNVVS